MSFHIQRHSATFPLTFAYISDCVADKKKRAPAFGLALATFGLSFCLGPVSGSYLARQFGDKSVFFFSFALVLVNICYITFYLPETVKVQLPVNVSFVGSYFLFWQLCRLQIVISSLDPIFSSASIYYFWQSTIHVALEYLPHTWNFEETFRVFRWFCAENSSISYYDF